jgi:signal transduction histidine kinase
VQVTAATEGQEFRISIRDDGVGGADIRSGSGLAGLRDRVEALGGTFDVHSPSGGGTALVATLPLEAPPGGHDTRELGHTRERHEAKV